MNDIAKMYKSGMTQEQIAKKEGVHRVTILRRLRAAGLRGRTQSEYMIGKSNARKYRFNQGYFQKITTGEQAYWMGLLAADGSIDGKGERVVLSVTDEELVQGLKAAVGSSHEIWKYQPKKGRKPVYRLTLCSKKMVESLSKWGVTANKSIEAQPPVRLQSKLIRHFVRGLWDGDGSVGKERASVCGSKDMIHWVEAWLHSQGLPAAKPTPNGRIFAIEYRGRVNLLRLRLVLYHESSFSLTRKKELFLSQPPRYLARVPRELKERINS